MNIFERKQTIEQQSESIVLPFLKNRGWEFEKHPALSPLGDYKINRNGVTKNIELKAEKVKYPLGNTQTLAIEYLSNAVTGRLGWFYTLTCDWLLYHILETNTLFVLDIAKLKKFPAYEYRTKTITNALDDGQHNPTLIWSVPVDVLDSEGVITSKFEL